jgi:hypothetical protein
MLYHHPPLLESQRCRIAVPFCCKNVAEIVAKNGRVSCFAKATYVKSAGRFSGKTMANEWHYTLNGQQAATPVPSAQLKQLAVSGQLKPTDLVWQDGMPDWVPASSVKGLFPSGKSLGDSAVVPPAPAEKASGVRKPSKPAQPLDWANMHPALVLVLTLATAGIFGLVYAYKVGHAYSQKAAGRKTDAAGRTLGRVRHPLGVLALSYLTCGIYFYYWIYRVLGECNAYIGRTDFNPRTELTLMLIFPPYAVHVAVFQLPDLIRRTQTLAGVPETLALRQAVLFLNPCLFCGLPFLATMYQEILNQIWFTAP